MMFLYLLPRRWWFAVNWPYFSIGMWLISFGRLNADPEEAKK